MPIESTPTYAFDPTGKLAANLIVGEQQILTEANYRDFHFIVPKMAPYFAESLSISFRSITNEVRPLNEGVDYYCTHEFIGASRSTVKPVFGSISFLDLQLAGVVTLSYQTLGDVWVQEDTKIAEILADRLHNPRITAWESVVDMPYAFPPIDHAWDLTDLVGASEIVASLQKIEQAILVQATDSNNAALTPADVGLGNVDNTHDLDKPISNAAAAELAKKEILANKATNFATVNDTLYPTVKAAKTYTDTAASNTLVAAQAYTDAGVQAAKDYAAQNGGGNGKWSIKRSAYVAVAGDKLAIDTSNGAFTVTLPANPNVADFVEFIDIGLALSQRNLTVGRNGSTIEGLAEDMIVDTNRSSFGLIYTGNTWRNY